MNKNLLIIGAKQEDRFQYATHMAMSLLCKESAPCMNCSSCKRVMNRTHANVFFIGPQSNEEDQDHGEIKIEQVRKVIEENHKANFEDGLGIFIISHAHQLSKSAANALLKTIEETNLKKCFLALAPSRSSVLATIASRMLPCLVKPSPSLMDLNIKTDAQKIWQIIKTKKSQRLELIADFPLEKHELLSRLASLNQATHEMLHASGNTLHPLADIKLSPILALAIFKALQEAEKQMRKNLNLKLIIELLIFNNWPYTGEQS